MTTATGQSYKRLFLAIGALTFGICLIAGLVSLLSYRNVFYTSDTLYLPALFRSLNSGGRFSDWDLPHAASLFPDIAVYWLVNTVIANFNIAVVVTGAVQLIAFVAGLLFISYTICPPNLAAHFLVMLSGALYFVVFVVSDVHYVEPLLTLFHFGPTIVGLWCLGLWLRLVGFEVGLPVSASRVVMWAIFVLLLCITSLSDLIFVLQYIIPSLICLLFFLVTRQISIKRLVIVGGLTTLPCGLGLIAAKLFLRTETVGNILRPSRDHIVGSLRDIGMILRGLTVEEALFMALGLIFLALCAGITLRAIRTQPVIKSYETILIFLLVLAIVNISVLIPIHQVNVSRYMMPSVLFPLLYGWPFMIGALPRLYDWLNRPIGRTLLVGSAALLILSQTPELAQAQSLSQYADYYPPLVACMDSHQATLNSTTGLAHYWQARYITMLTRDNLFVAQIKPNLAPLLWINDRTDYQRDFYFIMIDPDAAPSKLIHPEIVAAKYGQPSTQFKCQNTTIYVYDHSLTPAN